MMGGSVQVPGVELSVCPACALPEIVGSVLFEGGEVGFAVPHPGSALHTFRRPPLITLVASEGTLSTLSRMSAFNAAAVRPGALERISAAAPDPWGAAIEPPVR